MDKIKEGFEKIRWKYAQQDPQARVALTSRIEEAGRRRALITYSELAKGITFHLPTLQEPKHRIDVSEWQDLDRAIIGDFLGHISMESYDRAGFFASALVVAKRDGSPSEGFYALLKELGLIASSKTDKAMYLWADQVAKAHAYYSKA